MNLLLLPLENIDVGAQISFTDNGWLNADHFVQVKVHSHGQHLQLFVQASRYSKH